MIIVRMTVLYEEAIASKEILKYRSFDIFDGDTNKHKTVSFDTLDLGKLSRKEEDALVHFMRNLMILES